MVPRVPPKDHASSARALRVPTLPADVSSGVLIMADIKAGDSVDHISTPWDVYPVVERVDSVTFPEDPVAFFVGGGFWRTSRLVKVKVKASDEYVGNA